MRITLKELRNELREAWIKYHSELSHDDVIMVQSNLRIWRRIEKYARMYHAADSRILREAYLTMMEDLSSVLYKVYELQICCLIDRISVNIERISERENILKIEKDDGFYKVYTENLTIIIGVDDDYSFSIYDSEITICYYYAEFYGVETDSID